MAGMRPEIYRSSPKALDICLRLLDIIISIIMLVVCLPLFAIIMIIIKLNDGGPIFFTQERAGYRGKLFKIYKFRTMSVGAQKSGAGLYIDGETDKRITPPGRFLRKSSVDELPQLINILKGDMSLVGPRPGMRFQMKKYTQRQMIRLTVKPGLTGWAQVNGRNTLSWPQRIEYDINYIEKRSLLFYLRIILMTLPSLLKGDGIYANREKFLFNSSGLNRSIAKNSYEEEPSDSVATLK